MNYKKAILDRLLDRFERSKAYLDGSSSRRIMIRLCSGDMPEYDIEKTAVRELVNSTVQDLAGKGIVRFEWMKFEHGNIIDRVWLCPDRTGDAYREAERVPKRDKADTVLEKVRDLCSHVSERWIRDFLKDAEEGIDARKSITPYLPGDPDMAEAVLEALKGINDKDNEECLERVFSLRCFGDTKFFERNVKKRIAGLIREYLVREKDSLEAPADEEMLAQVGIVRAFEQIDFCGGIEGRLGERQVDFSVFGYGIGVNSRTVKELKVTGMGPVKKVLFIENKTNYIDYVSKNRRENELVLFHGGFYSPVKGEFFRKVYEAGRSTGVEFYHWGDIDIGGFRMFKRLKANIIPELEPFLMDREAFMSKEQYWLPFDKRYGNVLENMLTDQDYSEFHDVMEVMLKAKARLEQEAFL